MLKHHQDIYIQPSTVDLGPPEYWDNLQLACDATDIPVQAFRRDGFRWLSRFGLGEVGAEFLPLLPAQRRVAEKVFKAFPDALPSEAEQRTVPKFKAGELDELAA